MTPTAPLMVFLIALLAGAGPALGDPVETKAEPAGGDRLSDPATPGSRELLITLLEEIDLLNGRIDELRQSLAQSRLEATEAQRELRELWQFIVDHEDYGRDFEQYSVIKAIAERDAVRRQAQENRMRRDAELARRAARLEAVKSQRTAQEAQLERIDEYRQAGFAPLGLDVFLGQSAFFYSSSDGLGTRIKWDPRMGNYLRVFPYSQVDFSAMIISGSVLNASAETRNIGIAVSFFDESGNQVGAEIIRINNARPDVPYPFTATLAMALDRPFASSSSYVLYADPVEPELAASD